MISRKYTQLLNIPEKNEKKENLVGKNTKIKNQGTRSENTGEELDQFYNALNNTKRQCKS